MTYFQGTFPGRGPDLESELANFGTFSVFLPNLPPQEGVRAETGSVDTDSLWRVRWRLRERPKFAQKRPTLES